MDERIEVVRRAAQWLNRIAGWGNEEEPETVLQPMRDSAVLLDLLEELTASRASWRNAPDAPGAWEGAPEGKEAWPVDVLVSLGVLCVAFYLGSGMYLVTCLIDGALPLCSRMGYVHGVVRLARLPELPADGDEAAMAAWAARALSAADWLKTAVMVAEALPPGAVFLARGGRTWR